MQEDYNKYGLDKFEFSILKDNIDLDKLLDYETKYIILFGGIENDLLYNEEDKLHFTELAKANMSKNRKGKLCGKQNGMYGTHRFGKDNPMYGKKHNKQTKQIIGEKSKLGKKYFKYTPEFVEELRKKKNSGYKLKDLKNEYGIAISTLSVLINYGSSKNSLNKV